MEITYLHSDQLSRDELLDKIDDLEAKLAIAEYRAQYRENGYKILRYQIERRGAILTALLEQMRSKGLHWLFYKISRAAKSEFQKTYAHPGKATDANLAFREKYYQILDRLEDLGIDPKSIEFEEQFDLEEQPQEEKQ